jgi:putative membrane protein
MNQLKSSITKLAAVASVLGLAACARRPEPVAPSSGQMNPSRSDQHGSATGHPNASSSESTESGATQSAQYDTQTFGYETHPGTLLGSTRETTSATRAAVAVGDPPQAGTSHDATTGSAGEINSADESPMDATGLTDAQIAAVLQAVNSGEIKQAQLAQHKAESSEVKRFAQAMLTAHREMQSSEAMLFSRLRITPRDSAVSARVQTDAKNELSNLEDVTGRDFDRDYIDAQVLAQNNALELVDKMISNVSSSELRSDLQNSRTKIQQHLSAAERVRQTLSQSPGAPSK